MSARTILNIDTGNRTINPRSGSSVYVDLVSDQSIAGVKTFLNNLITNANVNCKNELNSDCLIITPLLSAPTYRLQLFGTAGGIKKLYYNISDELGLIQLSTTIWKINGAGASTFTSLNCGSGTIQTTGAMSGSTITATTSLTTNLINASTGTNINKIEMDNRFFNTSNGSIDIRAYYVAFPYITQTLTTLSKYMGFVPQSNGNFIMEINNITKKIMLSDWASTSIRTEYIWKWFNSSGIGYSIVIIDPNGSVPLEVFTDNLHSDVSYRFNSSGTLGLYANGLAIYKWTIDKTGSAVFGTITGTTVNFGAITGSSLTCGGATFSALATFNGGATFSVSPTFSAGLDTNTIQATSGTDKNKIQMDNRFFNTGLGSIDLKAYVIGFPYYTQTLTTLSKYFGIIPQSDGNAYLTINNISGRILDTDWSNKNIKTTDWKWQWFNSSSVLTAQISGIDGSIIGTSLNLGSSGSITSGNIVSGGISATGTILVNSGYDIQSTYGSINSQTFQSVNTNTYRNKIQMENLFISTTINSIDLRAQYIGLAHPSVTLTTLSTYPFFIPFTGGDIGLAINNVSGYALNTNHGAKQLETDYIFVGRKTGYTAGYKYQKFLNSGTEIGSISMFSASEVRFNQTSDYRLKQDIIDILNPLERLLKLKPKNYRYIKNVEENDFRISEGFIAHEVEDILPSAITGTKDDPENFQMLDYSSFTPLLTGAIQELNNKVDKMQVLIDSQYEMIKMLMTRLENLENK